MKNSSGEASGAMGLLDRTRHSLRTRYSLATGMFLLLVLATFYIGGRIVLVHFVRDTEQQVQDIGIGVTRFVNEDSRRIRVAAEHGSERLAGKVSDTAALLGEMDGVEVSLAVLLDSKGQVQHGHMRRFGKLQQLARADFKNYAYTFEDWIQKEPAATNVVRAAGIVTVRSVSHHCALVELGDNYLLLGTPFDLSGFMVRMNKAFMGMEVRTIPTRVRSMGNGAASTVSVTHRIPSGQAPTTRSYGIVPMISEAINFYSGGFWNFTPEPIEVAFAVRDIAGRTVSTIGVSLPRTLSNATSLAMGRLSVFVAMAGIVLIVPVFWLQCHLLLNPLSKMIECVRSVGAHHVDLDCPRIEWKGKDEFAQLAMTVNSMLETISRRALMVAQSEARLRALVTSIPDGLFIFDNRHRLVSVIKHPEGVWKVPGVSEGHQLDLDVWGEVRARQFNDALEEAFANGSAKIPLDVGAEGSQRHFDVRATRMDEHFVLAVFRDFTAEMKKIERRISTLRRDADSLKQESLSLFAAGIAHDVNNVFSVVLNTVEITWMDEARPEVRSAVQTVRDAVRHGCGMMRDLMAFAGETRMLLKSVRPEEIVQEVNRMVQTDLMRGIDYRVEVEHDLPAVSADLPQIWRALFNLVKNAAEVVGGAAGSVSLTAASFKMTEAAAEEFNCTSPLQPGPGVLFSVSDNGPGIPADVLPRLFDPYVSTRAAGRGLGLAIVYSIVDAHGGGIRVRSTIGKGTSLGIFLPSAEVEEAAPALDVVADEGGVDNEVLVVDDDPAILGTTSILLQSMGCRVHTAKDRHEAMVKLRHLASTLKCVIMDAHLGSMRTTYLLHGFRVVSPQLPVIVTSGTSREKIDEMFKDHPFDLFLAKPFTMEELREAISKVVRSEPVPDWT